MSMGSPKSPRSFLLILLLSYLISSMFRLSFGVTLPSIMEEFALDEAAAGWLYSIQLWLIAVLVTPFGVLCDRLGREKLHILGYFLFSISVALLGLSWDYKSILIALALAGISTALYIPPYYSIVGESLKEVRGLAIGLANSVFHVGGFAGSALVGAFVAMHRWRYAYLLIGFALFFLTAAQFLAVRGHAGRGEYSKNSSAFPSLRKGVLIPATLLLLGSVSFLAMGAWLPFFLINIGVWDAGLILGFFFLLGTISSPIFGAISDKAGRRVAIFLINSISALVAFLLFTMQASGWLTIVYALALGFFMAPYWNLSLALAQELVEKDAVSSATGVALTFGFLGSALGPAISGTLISSFGLNSALLYVVVLPLLISNFLLVIKYSK